MLGTWPENVSLRKMQFFETSIISTITSLARMYYLGIGNILVKRMELSARQVPQYKN